MPTKQQTSFGDKRHLLVTRNGVIGDFVLAPADASDVRVGAELRREQCDLLAIGDTGYSSASLAAALQTERALTVGTVPRSTQRQPLPAAVRQRRNRRRQIIEPVHGQLSDQLHLDGHHAHTCWGRCARRYTKLTAHTLCLYLNRLLGQPACLHIKALAFPAN